MACEMCKIELRDPKSIIRGRGPVCAAKYEAFQGQGTNAARIAALEAIGDETIDHDLYIMRRAVACGRKKDLEFAARKLEHAERQAKFILEDRTKAQAAQFVITKPTITIQKMPRGDYEIKLPFANESFLVDFKLRVGEPFRCFNTFRTSWRISQKHLTAAEFPGLLELIAGLIDKHFRGYSAVINHEIQMEVAA